MKNKVTLNELRSQAKELAAGDSAIVYEVLDDTFQLRGNVEHMWWFRNAIMEKLILTTKKWRPLLNEFNVRYGLSLEAQYDLAQERSAQI